MSRHRLSKKRRVSAWGLTVLLALFALLIYFSSRTPEASEVSSYPLETLTGTLRLANPSTPNYFLVTTYRLGVQVEVFTSGVNNEINQQLTDMIGQGEVTLYGRYTPNDRRPRLFPTYIFLTESLTPPPELANSCDDTRMDFGFVIDNSVAMDSGSPKASQLASAFMAQAVPKLQSDNDTAALLTFPRGPLPRVDFTTDFSQLLESSSAIAYDYPLSILRQGIVWPSGYIPSERRYKETGPLPGVAIILTNSQETITAEQIAIVTEDFKERDLRYYFVSFGNANPGFPELASAGGGAAYTIRNEDQVEDTVNLLFNRINLPYSHCITIETSGSKPVIRPGTTMTLTYTIRNKTRQDLTNLNLRQFLPEPLRNMDNRSVVSQLINRVRAGETVEYQVQVKRD